MNRLASSTAAALAAWGLATAASAQEQDFPAFPAPEQGSAPSMPAMPSEEMQRRRAAMTAMRPVMELMGHLAALNELSRDGKLTFTAEQKPLLTRLLTELQGQPLVNQRNAPNYLSRLKASLSPEQAEAVNGAVAERAQRMRERMAAAAPQGQPGPAPVGVAPAPGGGATMIMSGGAGGGGGGELPPNPFAAGSRMARPLTELLERLAQP